jgi:hypothetical protein
MSDSRKSKQEYRFRHPHKVTPEDVQAAKETIESQGKPFDCNTLLDYSRDPDSRTYAEFTWDNEIAGEILRLIEARKLVADWYTVEVTVTGVERSRPAVVSVVSIDGGREWKDSAEVEASDDGSAQMFDKCLEAYRGIITRFVGFESCKPLVMVAKKVLRKYADPVTS